MNDAPDDPSSDDVAMIPTDLKMGIEVIARFAVTLPHKPGVYRMMDASGDVLYVGKAKSLKNRVTSYARGQAHSHRVAHMITLTTHMEFITTDTETEALLLEANLIKQLRPRYNVLLRDDKSFPYILLSTDHEAPQLIKHRGGRARKGRYFGPFASGGAVNHAMLILQRAFLIRTCEDSEYASRKRPCLLYQIKRCSAPCTGEISHQEYGQLVQEACDFLSGKSGAVQKRLANDMQTASEALEFEKAAAIRDRLAVLSTIQATQGVNLQGLEEADVFAIATQGGHICIMVFFIRNFQNWGNRAYYPKADAQEPLADILGSFLTQFYDDKPPPRFILSSEPILEAKLIGEALASRMGHKVEVLSPQRGEKSEIVQQALRNAHEALARKLAESTAHAQLLKAVGEALGMPCPPRRIEVYDNSHISGTNAVGGMIVSGPDGFMKAHYRLFTIASDTLTPGDDYAMMKEVLTRRFKRLVKAHIPEDKNEDKDEGVSTPKEEDNASFISVPDLLLIDGGAGQMEVAKQVLDELIPEGGAISRPFLVGVAKGKDRDAGRETFFIPKRSPFKLPPRDAALYYIQRLRDEAHRFAIGAHRAKRSKAITKSELDDIKGIGPRRKRALLLHFGTSKAVSKASMEDLMRASGVNAATAQMIYNFFQGEKAQ
jgi:excinuclease ABC subunit C